MAPEMNEQFPGGSVGVVPLLLDAKDAAALCGVSRSHWLAMHSQGKTPSPVRMGRAVRWNRPELGDWIEAGCPARQQWLAMRDRRCKRSAS